MDVRKGNWVLQDAQAAVAVKYGQVVTSFRGDKNIVEGGRPPLHENSTGRVYTDRGEYFPGVYGLMWIQD